MLDHLTLLVSDFQASKAFYLAALKPLGYHAIMEVSRERFPSLPFAFGVGLGVGIKPDLWLRSHDGPIAPTHVAFRAETRALVHAFHAAALAAGGIDHGAPGLRAEYHPNYYGAFVLDPDGYNIEAVKHDPE
jgi:catechol 2,3-dioxygenase-like lactoylglutathione lyase family enzyme